MTPFNITHVGQVSGFTFIKNGVTLGYPFIESILSIAPLCQEVVINVGHDDEQLQSDDGTHALLLQTFKDPKFKFIHSWWDPSLRKAGTILAQQTNIALKHCRFPICFYIQGDEIIHPQDYPAIDSGFRHMESRPEVEGLVFNYTHFQGSPQFEIRTRRIYQHEVRVIRNSAGITSYRDAQGFRKESGEKLKCIKIPATVYHYGWCRNEKMMDKKIKSFEKLYHSDDVLREKSSERFQFEWQWGMKPFPGTHPPVMDAWIEKFANQMESHQMKYNFKFKDLNLILSDYFEKIFGFRIGEYRNYHLLPLYLILFINSTFLMAKELTYQGIAKDQNGQTIYREFHQVELSDEDRPISANTKYTFPDGVTPMGEMTSQFTESISAPNYEYIDFRSGNKHGIRRDVQNEVILFYQDKNGPVKEKKLSDLITTKDLKKAILIGCQGLHYHIYKNFQTFENEIKTNLIFLIPGKLDFYTFALTLEKRDEQISQFKVSIKNFLFSMFISDLKMIYLNHGKLLHHYQGISHILDTNGDPYQVNIDYIYPEVKP